MPEWCSFDVITNSGGQGVKALASAVLYLFGFGGFFLPFYKLTLALFAFIRKATKTTTPPPKPSGATEQQTKRPHIPHRESDPPEAPCQANRKEGAGHFAPPARPLEPVPPQGQPPNQALSNPALRLRLSPM